MKTHIFLKRFLSDEIIKYYLHQATKYQEYESKVSSNQVSYVNASSKIRKDIRFRKEDNLAIDNIIFNDEFTHLLAEHFNTEIAYRERYRLGTYYGNEGGFRSVHTDTEGYPFRRVSIIICLSRKQDYEGGHLYFTSPQMEFKLDRGDAIFFDSSLRHGVTPVTRGKRQVMITFSWDLQREQYRLKRFGIEKDPLGCTPTNRRSDMFNNNMPITGITGITNITNITSDNPSNVINTTNKATKVTDNATSNATKVKDSAATTLTANTAINAVNQFINDDIYLVDNKSDTLVMIFSGIGHNQNTQILVERILALQKVDILLVQDVKRQYFLTGLFNTSRNLTDTANILQSYTDRGYVHKVALGCSSGGYGAIMFGNLLGLDRIIAFSPQSVVDSREKFNVLKDFKIAPQTCKSLTLRLSNESDPLYGHSLNLKSYQPFRTPVEIHYHTDRDSDVNKRHAEYIQHNMCKLNHYVSNDCGIVRYLQITSQLDPILYRAISYEGGQSTYHAKN